VESWGRAATVVAGAPGGYGIRPRGAMVRVGDGRVVLYAGDEEVRDEDQVQGPRWQGKLAPAGGLSAGRGEPGDPAPLGFWRRCGCLLMPVRWDMARRTRQEPPPCA